jgi:hypothetical protein
MYWFHHDLNFYSEKVIHLFGAFFSKFTFEHLFYPSQPSHVHALAHLPPQAWLLSANALQLTLF